MVNYKELKDLGAEELINLAHKYLSVEDYNNTERILCELLDLEPTHSQGLFMLGKLYKRMERAGVAETLYRRALEGDPLRPEIWCAIGSAIDSYINAEESIKYLKKALS